MAWRDGRKRERGGKKKITSSTREYEREKRGDAGREYVETSCENEIEFSFLHALSARVQLPSRFVLEVNALPFPLAKERRNRETRRDFPPDIATFSPSGDEQRPRHCAQFRGIAIYFMAGR